MQHRSQVYRSAHMAYRKSPLYREARPFGGIMPFSRERLINTKGGLREADSGLVRKESGGRLEGESATVISQSAAFVLDSSTLAHALRWLGRSARYARAHPHCFETVS